MTALILLAVAAPARAEPVALTHGEMMVGAEAGLTWDVDDGRLAGGELASWVDWHGLGLLVRADYQIQRQIVIEQEQEVRLEHGSGAAGIALHVSPVRLLDHRTGRIIDGFIEGGVDIGLTQKAGGYAPRGGAYITLGAAMRIPIPRRDWMPTLSIRWTNRAVDPDFVFGELFTVSIGYVRLSDDRPRD